MILVSEGPGLDRAEAEAHLRALVAEPHPSLVEHFSRVNGARARDYSVSFGDESTGGLTFLGFGYGAGDVHSAFDALRDRTPPGFLPIARDAGGNYFVVTPTGAVRFFDHDVGRTLRAFDNIDDLLAALVYDPPTRHGPDYAGMPLPELEELIATDPSEHGGEACRAGRIDAVAHLLARHAAHAGDFLFRAVQGGSVPMVEALLDRGVSVDARNRVGATALMAAALESNLVMIELLLTRGADPTLEKNGKTAARKTPTYAVRDRLLRAIGEWESR